MANDFPAIFNLQAHDLRFCLGDRKPERRARSDDHRHYLSNPSDDRDTKPASSAYSIPYNLCTFSSTFPSRPSTFHVRCKPFFSPISYFRWSCTMLSVMAASARKRFSATRSTAVKNMLNSSGESTHPCLRPCPTSNESEHTQSSNRTHACMPSWNWRMTAIILGGTNRKERPTGDFGRRGHMLWRGR